MAAQTRHHEEPLVDLPGVDPASQGAVRALLRLMRLQRSLMQKLLVETAGQTVHPGQAMCLRALAGHDGVTQRDLAAMLHVSRPTVTTMLQRMEQGGSVERRVDPDDQRLTRVYLTPAGRQLEEQLRVVHAEHVRRTFGRMPEQDRRELERLLHALSENALRALDDAGAPDADDATAEGRPDR